MRHFALQAVSWSLKVDLVFAVAEQKRAAIQSQIAALESGPPDAIGQLFAYVTLRSVA
jgi:hypothetical protein